MVTIWPLPTRSIAGRNALRTQKWARVLAPKVLSIGVSRLCFFHGDSKGELCDILLGEIEQELALDHTGIIDDDRRVPNLRDLFQRHSTLNAHLLSNLHGDLLDCTVI